MGRHRKNGLVFACRMGANPKPQPRPCGGSAWGWLLFVGLIVGLPWFWACDGKSSSSPRKVTFKLEHANEDAAATLEKVKETLEKLKRDGKLTAGEFQMEWEKAVEALKGKGETFVAQAQDLADQAVAKADEARQQLEGHTAVAPRPPQSPRPPRTSNGRTVVVKSNAPRGSTVAAWDVQLEPNDGYGYTDNPERAKEKVIDKACDVIAQWIREHDHPYSTFKPDLTFLKKEGIIKAGPEAEPVKVGDLEAWTANVHIALTESSQRELKERGARAENNYRLEQAWDRQQLGLKVLGGISALLVAMVTFFHLDDRTRGYYTKPLAVVLFAGAALLGGAVLMMFARGAAMPPQQPPLP